MQLLTICPDLLFLNLFSLSFFILKDVSVTHVPILATATPVGRLVSVTHVPILAKATRAESLVSVTHVPFSAKVS